MVLSDLITIFIELAQVVLPDLLLLIPGFCQTLVDADAAESMPAASQNKRHSILLQVKSRLMLMIDYYLRQGGGSIVTLRHYIERLMAIITDSEK